MDVPEDYIGPGFRIRTCSSLRIGHTLVSNESESILELVVYSPFKDGKTNPRLGDCYHSLPSHLSALRAWI